MDFKQLACLLLVQLACLTSESNAQCSFARAGQQDIPEGHPAIRAGTTHPGQDIPERRPATGVLNSDCNIPDCYLTDPTGTSITNHMPGCGKPGAEKCSNYNLIQTRGFLESLVLLRKHHNADLCYWAFQSLPPPPNQERNISDADAESILYFGSLANKRYHGLVGNGVMEGGLSAAGNLVNQNLCDRGILAGARCDPRILNSALPVPMAIQMIRISNDGADSIRKNITAWRTEKSLHLPNLEWAMRSGWGVSGAVMFKVLKCTDIPIQFRSGSKTVEPDSLTPDGKNLNDEAVRVWQKMDSLCPPALWFTRSNATGCGLPDDTSVQSVTAL